MRVAPMPGRVVTVGILLAAAAAAAAAEGRAEGTSTLNTALTRKVDISTQFARVRSYADTFAPFSTVVIPRVPSPE